MSKPNLGAYGADELAAELLRRFALTFRGRPQGCELAADIREAAQAVNEAMATYRDVGQALHDMRRSGRKLGWKP